MKSLPEGTDFDETKTECVVPLKMSSNGVQSISMVERGSTDIFWTKQQSGLPSFATQCKFEWKNLNVYIGNAKNGKQILYNSNGSIESGQLLAVMGGSGAGKSTLLNVLSGRSNLNEQSVSGCLAINGQKISCSDQDMIKSLCTYVPQSDILCPTQTVEEALEFYARLKLSSLPAITRKKRIDYLIHVLHLNKCRNSCIGDEKKRGISGGEKRRVSIASEILNDVDIIFLDEPTSGLDAYTAARTIKTLKQFCSHSNKIIIATIHQPSMEVFYLFDKLILLSDGKCCFNSCIDDIDTFFKDTLRPKTNPADVIVFEVQKNADKYATKWEGSSLNNWEHKGNWQHYTTFSLTLNKNNIKTNGKMAPRMLQLALLLKREVKGLIRNKRLTVIRLLQLLFFALICALCYSDIKQTFSELLRCFFLMILIILLFGIVTLLTVFPKQKLLFEREYNSKTYNITSWILTTIIIEIPREMIHMIIFMLIAYPIIELRGDFIEYWITFLLAVLSGGSFGLLFGTICRTTVEAAQTVPGAIIPLLVFSDGLIRISSLPSFLHWIASINPLYYLFRCLYIIEFNGAVYARSLSEAEEEVCDSYQEYVFKVSTVNETDYGLDYGVNRTALNECMNISNNGAYYSMYDGFTAETTSDGFNGTAQNNISQTDIYNYTTEQQKIDSYCSETVSYTYFFNRYSLDANSLTRYWLFIVLICVVLRLISMIILLVKNNGIRCCPCRKRYVVVNDASQIIQNNSNESDPTDLDSVV